jgi:hypothetical protein
MPSLLPPLTHEVFEGAFAANFRRLFPACQRNPKKGALAVKETRLSE